MAVLNVIVIDDDQSLCYSIKEALDKSEEFQVTGIAFNGQEAIKLIELKNPDVVILDIIMPKVDGLDVLAYFKDNKKIEFIVLSAVEHDLVTRKAIELGAMFYLMKPFDLNNLSEKMKSLFTGENIKSRPLAIASSIYYKAIEDTLYVLEVPRHMKGYRYIYHGIYEILQNDPETFKITRDIYPKLAEQFTTTPSSVEKAIRSAVDMTINRGEIEFLKSYFSNELFNDKITNKAFMMKVATEIKKMV